MPSNSAIRIRQGPQRSGIILISNIIAERVPISTLEGIVMQTMLAAR
jgi:hypothetical protein